MAIEQSALGHEGLDGQPWRRRIVHEAACERIKPPRGHRQRKAILEFDAQTLRGLTSSPPDDFTCLAKEGMMMGTDTDYRRMMSSVEIPSATASRPISWKPGWTCALSNSCSAIASSMPRHAISTSAGSTWPRCTVCAIYCPLAIPHARRRSTVMPVHTAGCSPAAPREAPGKPPREVADVLRHYGESYRAAYRVPPSHHKVMYDILVCRTAALGGHAERCPPCGFER
jgi:hypothetical protein